MCLSCGCGDPNNDHGDARNITLRDIDEAARAAGTTRERVVMNIVHSMQKIQQVEEYRRRTGSYPVSMHHPGEANLHDEESERMDGYVETQRRGYGEVHNTVGQPASQNPAQQGYDPAHSGVQSSRKRPGARVPSPGREEGTAWANSKEYTTDSPEEGNPTA
uniref:Uncharacterized protein n=1 Tax=Thermosporothrix sp. COM3 TaxID=2490863 RepID=A0A455SRP0_9CHLR|nr:hypothetical protein KTC_58340 [Thermosporothrix sp. COM3]